MQWNPARSQRDDDFGAERPRLIGGVLGHVPLASCFDQPLLGFHQVKVQAH